MIWFVLDNPDLLDDLLDAWYGAGVSGATIIESTGIYRRRKQLIPMRYLFQAVGSQEEGHYTLMAIVKDEAVIADCLQATENLVGDLDQPNTGIFAAWPLTTIKGLPLIDKPQESE
jgi:hypothetical protein